VTPPLLKPKLDALYRRWNRRAFVHPDPLELVYRWESPADQEIAGLIAATLAYGRVAQILASVGRVFALMGDHGPHAYLERATPREIRERFAGFKHRFTTGPEMAALLVAVRAALAERGSLERLFVESAGPHDESVLPALARFVEKLRALAETGSRPLPSLLSSPEDGSACKRLNLWLRWMVRKDAVDPGPWQGVPRARLVVPLDTHMFRIGRGLAFTARRQANLATALEITAALARCAPRDPVRYDFALTRLGINPACRDEEIECILEGNA
jgi:uncharacterized protein (TIGR02757 family)